MMPWAAAWLLAVLPGAVPALVTSGDLEPQDRVRAEAARAWSGFETAFARVTQLSPRPFNGSIAVRRGELQLRRGRGGESRPGEVWLRQGKPFTLDERELESLRHELAHQFLFGACPQAAADRLFHEAFALSVSGELGRWTEGDYGGLSWALAELSRPGADLDSRSGRRALARLLVEGLAPGTVVPRALEAPLKRCADGTSWVSLQPRDLAEGNAGADVPADVFVAIHRVSGEVVLSQGQVDAALPYGSTLKPFVVAGAGGAPPPVLPPGSTPEWVCGEGLRPGIGAAKALSRSCNGYFLDWGARAPGVARLGAWGPVLVASGLGRVPADMPEAIGVRATLALSPLGLARAYRVLARARPDVLEMLRDNPRDGTLSGLDVSGALDGLALKTGTIRDAQSRPRYGWIVAVSDTLVAVMVKSGRMPRSFAGELRTLLGRAASAGGDGSVKVQVFGLVDLAQVRGWCDGAAFALAGAVPRPVPRGAFGLREEAARGDVLCLDGPFRVELPGIRTGGERLYAGIFSRSEPPPYRPPEGPRLSERARRARQGSELVFETSRSLYAAGVVEAEDSRIAGEARVALLRVVDANGQHSRHGGRPVCDTTHCQVFLGTVPPRTGDRTALARPLEVRDWLHFSRGGEEAWREERPLRDVEELVGGPFISLEMRDGQVIATRSREQGEAIWDDADRSSCETLRGPLKLPSCPSLARRSGSTVMFEGRGRGHGLGLDVEWAKASGLPADELLRRAYRGAAQRRGAGPRRPPSTPSALRAITGG